MKLPTDLELQKINSCGLYDFQFSEGRWWKRQKKHTPVELRKAINALAVVHNTVLVSTALEGRERQVLLDAIRIKYNQLKRKNRNRPQARTAEATTLCPFLVEYDRDTSFMYT